MHALPEGHIQHFDMAERYFNVALQPFFFFFVKILFRPCIVLSRLFVSKIQPEVCTSVCECT